MKKFAILIVLALELAICGCANNAPNTIVSTTTNGNWEAQLTGGTDQASLLNFTTVFSVTANSGATEPLNISSLYFFNQGACFGTNFHNETVTGSVTLDVSSTNQVTGSMTLRISSTTSNNVLTLTAPDGGLTGTTNGTPGTVGTLSNGVVSGTWTLTGGSGDPSCTGTGSFIMCQGKNTCTVP
jgi:hypothetical protein